MANVIISYPNQVDATYYTVAFSQGSWAASLPLTNLRSPLLAKVARSMDDATASTKFLVDLGAPRDITIIAGVGHNLSRIGATWRARGYSDAGLTSLQYDTTAIDPWPILYPFGSLPFHHPSWWDGKLEPEKLGDYPKLFIHKTTTTAVARYWLFEFSDTSNEDGYVQLSRLILAPGWQPDINMQYGAQLGWETDTSFETSLGGVRFFTRRNGRRVVRFVIRAIDFDEAMVWPFEMMREQGTDRQVMFVFNPDDTEHMLRRSFLARMRQLSPLEFIAFDNAQVAFELEEVL